MIKRISILTCIIVLWTGTISYALLNEMLEPLEKPQFDIESQVLTIRGKLDEVTAVTIVNMQILYPNKTISNLKPPLTSANSLVLMANDQKSPFKNGEYVFKVRMHGNTGEYTIRVGRNDSTQIYEGKFYYVNPIEREVAIKELNKVKSIMLLDQAVIAMEKAITCNIQVLGIDFPLFNVINKQPLYHSLVLRVKDREYTGVAEVLSDIKNYSIIHAFNQEKKEYLIVNEDFLYNDVLQLDKLEIYSLYRSNISKNGIHHIHDGLMGNKFTEFQDIRDRFIEQVIIYAIKDPKIEGYGHIEEILRSNNLALDLTKYNSVYNKAVVAQWLMAADFTNKTQLQQRLDDISDKQKQKENSIDSPTGSTTGSTIGSTTPNITIKSGEITPPIPLGKPQLQRITFNDLGSVEWAAEAIHNLAEKGIVSGNLTGQFIPNDLVTREEFIKMLVLAFGLLDKNSDMAFKDVSKESWYYPYVASAYKAGITDGIGDGNFGVGRHLTREEMAVLSFRVATTHGIQLTGEFESINFGDNAEISGYALDAVTVMQRANIINGIGNNLFAPKDNSTRAQAAKILYHFLELLQK